MTIRILAQCLGCDSGPCVPQLQQHTHGVGFTALTVSLNRPGIVGDSAATDAMSPPITCTAGCSGSGAAEAIVSTQVCSDDAMLAISGIGTARVVIRCRLL